MDFPWLCSLQYQIVAYQPPQLTHSLIAQIESVHDTWIPGV